MLARWVAISLMVVVLVLVGAVAGTVLLGRKPDATGPTATGPVLGAATERLSGTAGSWTVTAELTRGAANEVTIVLTVENAAGAMADQPADLAASLRMLDMSMGSESVPLSAERTGEWRGAGRISMNGRWALIVTIDGDIVELPFAVAAP